MKIRVRRQNALRFGSVAFTLAVIAAYPYLPEKRLNITHNPAVTASGFSDEVEPGGQSRFNVTTGPTPTLFCDVREGADFRYCGVSLELHGRGVNYGNISAAELGAAGITSLDLTPFNEMSIQLEYEGVRDLVSLSLLGLSDIQDIDGNAREVTRHMDVLLHRRELNSGPITVDLKEFQTAQWWLAEFNIPRHYSRPDITRITSIVVGLMDTPPTGEARIALNKLTLSGPLIAKEHFYLGIILYWLAFILMEGVVQFLKVFRQREEANVTLNALRKDYNDLTQTAGRDPLTGVFNRLSFNRLRKAFLGRYRENAYVLVIDLDHFKQINDRFGHQSGDVVLKAAAQAMQKLVREQDILVRWGGEEFVLLAANLSHEEVMSLGERLRDTLAQLHFDMVDVHLTASIGVSQIRATDSFNDAFDRADKALYTAKRTGRDRVVYRPETELMLS